MCSMFQGWSKARTQLELRSGRKKRWVGGRRGAKMAKGAVAAALTPTLIPDWSQSQRFSSHLPHPTHLALCSNVGEESTSHLKWGEGGTLTTLFTQIQDKI